MYYFCTYFDQNYLARGLALYRSLKRHCSEFKLWVLCLDNAAYEILEKLDLPGVYLIAMEAFERNDEPLRSAKQSRSKIAYYFTCTPSLSLYILNNWPEVDLITYVDADIFFFASPMPLFEELGNSSVAIIGHRFPTHLQDLEKYGIYNVGWLSFRRDENALICLRWWRERCLEWCYDRVEDGRYADQKYLDDWPERFRNVIVLKHKGANLAPWNLANYRLFRDGARLLVDEQPLIFFHFNGLEIIISQYLYNPNWRNYGVRPCLVIRRQVYANYIRTVLDVGRQLLPISAIHPFSGNVRKQGDQVFKIRHLGRLFRFVFFLGKDILTGNCIFVVNGLII